MKSLSFVQVSIIGLGNIGRALLLSLMNNRSRNYHINIIDLPGSSKGSVLDFLQGIEICENHKISFNSDDLFRKSTFIFHCAGVGVKQGASRLTTTDENINITRSIFDRLQPNASAKIIVISNPVDIISFYTWKFSNLPPHQVIGTGTLLDTARLNYYIHQLAGQDKKTDSLMLGEHGESIVWAKSHSYIDGISINEYFTEEQQAKLELDVIHSASRIKQTQGATIYAVTLCAIRIMEAILNPTDKVFSVSCMTDSYYKHLLNCPSIYIGLPVRIGAEGIKEIIPLKLSEDELAQLRQSASLVESHLIH